MALPPSGMMSHGDPDEDGLEMFEMLNEDDGHTHQTVPGYQDNKEAHLKRLRRVEGQIRGLQRMIESDTYCIDVLTQVSASTRALQSFALGLLDEHLSHCVADAVSGGGTNATEKVEEASAAIARLVRS